MQIYFTDTSGQIYTVDILPDQTVGDLKVKLTDMTGARQMSILANGKPLSNEDIVGESLKNEATVTMAANLRGGSGDDDEDEEEEASPEEKFQIASYFITQAPPGEVDFLVTDVKKLVGDPSILDEKNLNLIMKKHNEDNFVIGDADGKPAMFCEHGHLGDGKYFDPINNRVVQANFKDSGFEVTGDTPPSGKYEEYRAAIAAEAKKYLDSAYNLRQAPRVTKKHAVGVYANDDGDINVCISAINSKILASFWSGGWTSKYTLNVASKGSTNIAGVVKARVHCFEDGNVQLVSKLEKKTSSVDVGEAVSTAKALLKAIENIESEYQSSMEEMYIQLAQSAFKKMRRKLPVTQKKMDWRMAAHNVASQIHS
mmetsp:Transcript_41311/g.69009  ORF Transcript_41311/g.69009 Transcript_41311/m.69009 type:complete len:370 (-) Transcript_41311:205-1314(-)